MSKKINVSRDLESRARIAFEHVFRMPQKTATQPVESVESQKKEEDAQSPEEIRPEADQSSDSPEKPKKAGRSSKGNIQKI